jgi:thiol-disulfide isomerase/thioredoxin
MRNFAVFLLCLSSAFAAGELSGRRAPGFALLDVMTMKYHDPADYRGKVLIIDIMQSNCPHCAEFARILEKVKARYGAQVAILSITNPPDNQQAVSEFRRKNNVTAPILYDCGQVAGSYLKITPQRPSFNIPHVFLIDQQGIIRNDFGYGPLTTSIFEGDGIFAEIDKLLGASPQAKKK